MPDLSTGTIELETPALDVMCVGGRGRLNTPWTENATAREPWLRVTREGAIEVDASAVPAEHVRHRRRGDRVAVGRIQTGSTRIEVHAWLVNRLDRRALTFGILAGLIPFINGLMAAALAYDLIAHGRAARSNYRRWCERRENACLLAGLLPGLLAHAAFFFVA